MKIERGRPAHEPQVSRVTITFDGSAGAGATGTNVDLFTVTGEIFVDSIIGYCTTNLTEAAPTATISLGTTTTAAQFIAATNSVEIDANEFWVDTTPVVNVALPAALGGGQPIAVSENIVVVPATQNTDAGVIEFTMFWRPISTDAAVA